MTIFSYRSPPETVAQRHEDFEHPPEANFEYPVEDVKYYQQRPDLYRFYNVV